VKISRRLLSFLSSKKLEKAEEKELRRLEVGG